MSDLVSSLLCLFFGILVLSFVGYINWYGNIKRDSVAWIGKHISKPLFGDESLLADDLFMGVSVCLLVIGGFLTLPLILFLESK